MLVIELEIIKESLQQDSSHAITPKNYQLFLETIRDLDDITKNEKALGIDWVRILISDIKTWVKTARIIHDGQIRTPHSVS